MEKITCKVFDFDNPNQSYTIKKETFEKALKEYLSSDRQKLGELNPGPEEVMISLGRVSHRIDDMRVENEGVMADIELLDTPNGKMVQNLIHAGHQPKFAPRMIGEYVYETDEDGNKKVVDVKDLQIISIDVV